MTPFELHHETDDLTFFTQFPEPARRRSSLVAIADRETRSIIADHLERLGYDVWTARSGLDAYRTGIEHHENTDVLVCDENLPDLPPLVLFNRLKSQLPGLQCCVLTSVTHRLSEPHVWAEPVILDVVGWHGGMLFVNAIVSGAGR